MQEQQDNHKTDEQPDDILLIAKYIFLRIIKSDGRRIRTDNRITDSDAKKTAKHQGSNLWRYIKSCKRIDEQANNDEQTKKPCDRLPEDNFTHILGPDETDNTLQKIWSVSCRNRNISKLEQCIDKWRRSWRNYSQYDQGTDQQQYHDNWCQPVLFADPHKGPEVFEKFKH